MRAHESISLIKILSELNRLSAAMLFIFLLLFHLACSRPYEKAESR